MRESYRWRTAAACAVLLVAGACAPTKAYLAADAATYDAVAPEYLGYVAADAALDAAAKERRKTLIDSWKARLEAARK